MNKNNTWFTLVETIVWVSVSLILMVSVWVFVSTGMKNITQQKSVLASNSEILNFKDKLENTFWEKSSFISWTTLTWWLTFEVAPNTGNTPFVTLQTTENTCEYQATDMMEESDKITYKTLNFKYFLPFTNTSIDSNNYNTDYFSHSLTWTININKWYFWEDSWTASTLFNLPTGMTKIWTDLILADSGNHRILKIDNSWNSTVLLDYTDWMNFPTWLLYKSPDLYIVNSWNSEILKYDLSDTTWSFPDLNINFTSDNTFVADSFDLTIFYKDKSQVDFNTTPTTNFTNISWDKFNKIESWTLKNYFLNFSNPESNQSTCAWTEIEENLLAEIVQCTKTWSWVVWTDQNTVYSSWSTFQINLSSINLDITDDWNYYTKIDFLDDFSILNTEYFPYYNKNSWWIDNIKNAPLEKFTNNQIIYPTDIEDSGNIYIYDYISEKRYNIDNDTVSNNSFNLSTLPLENLSADLKIKDITYSQNWNLITFVIEYYKYLDCYDENNSITKKIIFKKLLD